MKIRFKPDTFPEPMRSLPYCVWKREKAGKVPYDTKTGMRARADVADTFDNLENAISAYENGGFSGIGFCIMPGYTVGCIDIDHCADDDGALDERAEQVLSIMPEAWAEYSPSHTGLHLYFVVPDSFVFDRDAYYVNSHKQGMEIYLPGVTSHFMTVTGEKLAVTDDYHAEADERGNVGDHHSETDARGNVGDHHAEPSMLVTCDQLQTFLDTFMRRPAMRMKNIAPPASGSILTDGEVIQKCISEDGNGQRFMALYRGDWEECRPDDYADNENWSRSEAELSLCRKLAFYCRGDQEQMDRLYRASGLYRDKWDRRLGNSTYGALTMNTAIAGCGAFYERPERMSAEDDFAPLDYEASIDTLLANELTTEVALSDDTLLLAAWAYKYDMLRYTKIREALPKSVRIRNFERAMKQKLRDVPDADNSEPCRTALLHLTSISTPGMVVPPNWVVSERGVSHLEMVLGEMKAVTVSSEPLFISAKMVNVDDGTEKLEVTFRRNGRYKTLIAPRSDLLNKASIIKYADEGLPVSSGTAGSMTKFIAEMEAANDRAIPLKRCIRRAGWVEDEFFPYYLRSPMTGQEDIENAERFLEHLHTEGSEQLWLNTAAKVRTMPYARAMLAASFASPLLYVLQHRNIYYHSWCGTRSGKTAGLKFAMSVWGDPAALVKSYFATMVGMEHRAGTMKHLPLALDELQTIEKRLDINNMVYTLGNGVGKTRGRAGGGIRATDSWQNCILSTGEQPISTDNSMDGINTRLFEVYGKPVEDEEMAAQMHQVAERNYGFAGEKFIRFIAETVLGKGDTQLIQGDTQLIQGDMDTMRSTLNMLYAEGAVKADNIDVICLADYYSSIAVFGLDTSAAWDEAIELGKVLIGNQKQEDHTDTVDRAWHFVVGWVAMNKTKFDVPTRYEPPETYGVIEGDKIYVINTVLNDALEEAGYSYRKCIRGFAERGYIDRFTDNKGVKRTQFQKSIKGINTRAYRLNLDMKDVDDDDAAFGSENNLREEVAKRLRGR